MKGTTLATMERNVRLLESIATARPRKKTGWGELCATLASELVSAIESIDRSTSPTDWRYPTVDRAEVLAGLARSLIATDQAELMSRLVDHALAMPEKYPLTEVQIKATRRPPALAREERREAIGRPGPMARCGPRATRGDDGPGRRRNRPTTAARPRSSARAPTAPSSSDSSRTRARRVLRLKAGKDRRRHLHSQIDINRIDLTHVTERRRLAPDPRLHQDHGVLPGQSEEVSRGPGAQEDDQGHPGEPAEMIRMQQTHDHP